MSSLFFKKRVSHPNLLILKDIINLFLMAESQGDLTRNIVYARRGGGERGITELGRIASVYTLPHAEIVL